VTAGYQLTTNNHPVTRHHTSVSEWQAALHLRTKLQCIYTAKLNTFRRLFIFKGFGQNYAQTLCGVFLADDTLRLKIKG